MSHDKASLKYSRQDTHKIYFAILIKVCSRKSGASLSSIEIVNYLFKPKLVGCNVCIYCMYICLLPMSLCVCDESAILPNCVVNIESSKQPKYVYV